MRYYLKIDPKGLGIIAQAAGGGYSTDTMAACPGGLMIQPGHSLHGVTWEQLLKAVEATGHIDIGDTRSGGTT